MARNKNRTFPLLITV